MRDVKKWSMGKRNGETKRERKRREVGRRKSTSITGQAVFQGTSETSRSPFNSKVMLNFYQNKTDPEVGIFP